MEIDEERYLKLSIADRKRALEHMLRYLVNEVVGLNLSNSLDPGRQIESMKKAFLQELDLYLSEVALLNGFSLSERVQYPLTAREVSERFP